MADENAEKIIGTEMLIRLLKKSANANSQTSQINGELGEAIKRSADKDNLHTGAFRIMVKLDRCEVLKRNAFIRSLRLYIDKLEESGRWDLRDMVEEAVEAEAEVRTNKVKAPKLAKAAKAGKKRGRKSNAEKAAILQAADRAEQTAEERKRQEERAKLLEENRAPPTFVLPQ